MQLETMTWGDLSLHAITRLQDGLVLRFARHEWGLNITYVVRCLAPQTVRIALEGTRWLTWTGDVKTSEGQHDLFLDFASEGELRVVCGSLCIERETP